MAKEKVTLVSAVTQQVGVTSKNLMMTRKWPTKGSKVSLDKEVFEQLLYEKGFKYLIDKGYLLIEGLDAEDKEDLGLDKTGPRVLTPAEMRTLLTTEKREKVAEIVGELQEPQVDELINFALKEELIDTIRANIIKEKTGKDLIGMYQRIQSEKEAVKKLEEEEKLRASKRG